MKVSVLKSKEAVYEGNVKMVVLPGEDGEFSVLDFHQPFLYVLRSGYIRITSPEFGSYDSRGETRILIKCGLASMRKNNLTVLVEAY